jgi:glycosyltransferase involved in cell wall biosynthesis
MKVSVEIPVFKPQYLDQAIQSVLSQSYKNWKLILLSDGASPEAQRIMKAYEDNKVECHFQENAGIGMTRNRLSQLSSSEFIFPLDDDDVLLPDALEEMVRCFETYPDAGLVRAKRKFIDENNLALDEKEWFPFRPRQQFHGMTIDLHNHAQPYMIRRAVYNKTSGWEGIENYKGAGEDCDIFLKIEEHADILLLDKVLYGYRITSQRFSRELGFVGAQKMWCYLADKTIARRHLKLKRLNLFPPFKYKMVDG